MAREVVINALRMARFRRKPAPGVLHHSDRGSQYCSHDYQALLAEYGMTGSMNRKRNCYSRFNKKPRQEHAWRIPVGASGLVE